MAGIYIPGMTVEEYNDLCKYARYGANNAMIGNREAISFPDHGRLIEAERLKVVFHRNVVGGDAFDQLIDIAPTIIPADKEEE